MSPFQLPITLKTNLESMRLIQQVFYEDEDSLTKKNLVKLLTLRTSFCSLHTGLHKYINNYQKGWTPLKFV